jgi:adenosylmethionine---8-amino-7-oxononanoate aminotransferase
VKHARKNYEALDKKTLWHPFTQMKDWIESPQLVIQRAKGPYLFDTQGRKYLDGVSSLWANVHGHSHPTLVNAVQSQIKELDHSTLLGLSHIRAIELAQQLIRLTPSQLTRVFYSDDGSTAVEVALKMSFHYWRHRGKTFSRKKRFVSFTNSYHGDTLGSVSLGGVDLFHRIYQPLLFRSYKAFYPSCYRCPFGKQPTTCNIYCSQDIERILHQHHREICAVIIEPGIQGAAGMLTAPSGFLKRVEALCRQFQVHLILDEVATGFGRTGKMFALEHENVSPDFVALAKGLTGGTLPLAATLTTEEIFHAFHGEYSEFKTFFHGHTYTGNALACAAALANLKIFRQEDTLKRLQTKIRYLKERLKQFSTLRHVGDVRQAGFMVGIELVQDRHLKRSFPVRDRAGHRVVLEARRRGIILRPLGDVIVVMPPLSITLRQLKNLLDVIHESIRIVTEKTNRAGAQR